MSRQNDVHTKRASEPASEPDREQDLARRLYALGPDVRDSLLELVTKAEGGHQKHGRLDLATDPRDFIVEALQESQDQTWYLLYDIRRLRAEVARLQGELPLAGAIAQVRAFHAAMGIVDSSTLDISREPQLRVALIEEELDELREALSAGSAVGVADALADLTYVIIGAAITWGIPLAEVFDEVHRSNMTKSGGGRRADGKVQKGPNYRRPDVAGVLVRAREANR